MAGAAPRRPGRRPRNWSGLIHSGGCGAPPTAGKGYWNGELTARAKDGHELVVEATWTLVRDAAGRPQSIFATSQDITETRRLEQQAARSQRIESLGTLASGVAHDLNNILTPIMVSIGLLKEQTKDPMLLRLLGSLDASTQRGAQLVKQILTFGRGVKASASRWTCGRWRARFGSSSRRRFPSPLS